MMTPPAFHIIDFEGHSNYGIIEYGVVTWADGEIVDAFGRLCAPEGGIPARDSAVHGLVAGDLSGVQPFRADYATFVQYRRTGQFVAHNASFEHRLLRHTWAFPPAVPSWTGEGGTSADWGPWQDSVVIAQTTWPDLASYRLETLTAVLDLTPELSGLAAKYCPVGRQKPHCALFDALATAVLLRRAWQEGWRPVMGPPQGELF